MRRVREVARIYRFRGAHSLPGIPGYEEVHEHDYKVEIVMDAREFINTDGLDELWEELDLPFNMDEYITASTVENISRQIAEDFLADFPIVRVTVWEDDERWGAWSC